MNNPTPTEEHLCHFHERASLLTFARMLAKLV
jgi:hypothetical protein